MFRLAQSSLLNALLDEDEILPTSGSRGCTAAVVELRYNQGFIEFVDNTIVYSGRVEFISLTEWLEELEALLDDCCSSGQVLAKAPEDGETKAAWDKINQVYGHGTMEAFKGKVQVDVLTQLSQDPKVVQLLKGANDQPSTIFVEEGVVDAARAKMIKEKKFSDLSFKLRREKKKWAKEFRSKINDYVYRKGNGKEAQTWPLSFAK